ncbi:hypothetical protein NXS98_07700 [Fontisphaera persica]|uniref:hypothetical protein n=1 Tax=Fontisphaera persica TaxID=2974023 RepID=UPI0024BF8821|nr:hypothetical protein [Fontisphaera persica]WCJ60993.1 hypothetical protein NXS98_07700 [Fontisphaera persica]
MLAARLVGTLEASVAHFLVSTDQNLGHLETQLQHDLQALLRETLRRAAQAKADATPPRCPVCGQPLSRCSSGHARTFQTRFGDITLERTRGYCQRCRQWRIPADAALGLDDTTGYSPTEPTAEEVAKEIAYLREPQARMDYRAGRRAGEPLGSGAVEATCRQAQCRFKRPGQFWSTAGDEALLCLETFWHNDRWSLFFPTRPSTLQEIEMRPQGAKGRMKA